MELKEPENNPEDNSWFYDFYDFLSDDSDVMYSEVKNSAATVNDVKGNNQKLFEATPEKYLPQYEGYCALAVSYGKKISIDPQTFKITDGKLYLFFHGKTGIRDAYVSDRSEFIEN